MHVCRRWAKTPTNLPPENAGTDTVACVRVEAGGETVASINHFLFGDRSRMTESRENMLSTASQLRAARNEYRACER